MQDPALVNLLNGEQLLFADKIKKTNMYDWTQERTLVITNKAIYNVHKKSVKRTIMVKDIGGMTKTVPPSKSTTEFTVHVPAEYDYRFLSPKRDNIMQLLKALYYAQHQKNCPVFGVPSKDLKEYTTTEKDMKKGVSRFPLTEFRLAGEDCYGDGVPAMSKQNSVVSDQPQDYDQAQQQRK